MRLHLIRHPEPLIARGLCYGRYDCPAGGIAEAAAVLRAALPPGLPCWSSPLRRCRDLATMLHPAPTLDGRLAEMDFGDWEGRPWDGLPRAELDAWAADLAGYAPPGGESALTVQRRALECVASLAVPEAVVVTHAGVIRLLIAHWRGLPPERWLELQFAYASCASVDIPEPSG